MSDEKQIQDVVAQMLKQAGASDPYILAPDGQPVSAEPNELQILAMVVQNLEMGMVQIAGAQESIGMNMDASRLTIQMLINVLVDKGICTREELEKRYKTDVADKILERQKQIKEQVEKQIEEAQAAGKSLAVEQDIAIHKAPQQPTEEPQEENAGPADITLPSERPNNVVRFPSKKEE